MNIYCSMENTFDLTISVVLYKNDPAEIQNIVSCIQQVTLKYKLILIDNSPTDILKKFHNAEQNIEYYFIGDNIGFGKAHNIAINKIKGSSKYHLILNPDITFSTGTLENIFSFMEEHKDIGQLMPRVFYPNGEIQKLCKLLPEPIDLIGRRFFLNFHFMQQRNNAYELSNFTYDKLLDAANLSGCFMFIRSAVLEKVNGFDKRFFMYLEDLDLTRRIKQIARTVYYPGASVIHTYHKGSYNNPKLFKHHILSAVKYFNKWGWFIDKERMRLNKEVLSQI